MNTSETRTEIDIARQLLEVRGWNPSHPPEGNLLWKNEYRKYPLIRDILASSSKTGQGVGYPDFILVNRQTAHPLLVGEAKADAKNLNKAIYEATENYANAFFNQGFQVLAVGIAGNSEDIDIAVQKRTNGVWKPISFRGNPIKWIPTEEETQRLLYDSQLFELQPTVPSPEILAKRGEELNRILRECDIKDEFRPAIIGAIMLGLWTSRGNIRLEPKYILSDLNQACKDSFKNAGKSELVGSIILPEANEKLASMASSICNILRLLNITTVTTTNDYLGQLYEAFFRFTGGNTIGQYFTPRHITKFVVDILEISKDDHIIDITCGTGGFLISALSRMVGNQSPTKKELVKLVSEHLIGFESEPVTASLAIINMILRGDGTTGIIKGDCFSHPDFPINKETISIGNPPFPFAGTDEQPEKFVNRALESLQTRGKLAMLVPFSLLDKSEKKKWRKSVLLKNTLHAVISLPSELFQPYATSNTAIIVLEKGVPHHKEGKLQKTFFCQIDNDGFELRKNVRVGVKGEQLTEAINSYNSKISKKRFCIWEKVSEEEWSPGLYIEGESLNIDVLHKEIYRLMKGLVSFYALHSEEIYRLNQAISSEILLPKRYKDIVCRKPTTIKELSNNEIGTMFDIYYGQPQLETKRDIPLGIMPIITSAGTDNGCFGFFDFSALTSLIKPPFVTIPRTGSVGEAFVQTIPCGATSDCILLIPKENIPIEILFIVASIIREEKWRFNYARKITPERIGRIKIPMSEELQVKIAEEFIQINVLIHEMMNVFSNDGLKNNFKELSRQWQSEKSIQSKAKLISIHPAYQQIIGMGNNAIPLILAELKKEPHHWFWALHSITGINPVPPEDRGKIKKMAEAWIKWGKEQGYIS